MEQEVAHSQGGGNLSHALKGSGEMTAMAHMYTEDGSQVLRFRMLSGTPE